MPRAIATWRPSSSACRTTREGPLLTRLLLTAYFVEVGLLLSVVPWTAFWERNYFAAVVPLAGALARNHFVRGAVTGLGVINLAAAGAELLGLFRPARH